MSESDFLSKIKIFERKISDSDPLDVDTSYNVNGFPEISHRSHSKLNLGRSIHCNNDNINLNDRISGSNKEVEKNVIEDKGIKVMPFKVPLIEMKKLEWTNPVEISSSASEYNMLHQIRYNFNGKIITNSNEYKSYTGLYNHGDEPDRAGYTISELIWLCQSKMSSQVNIALYTLSNIIENPPINTSLSQSKITHYRWYSYIYNDVDLINIIANLIERNLNSANTKLLLKILRLVLYGTATDSNISAYELFQSLYPEFGFSIYLTSNRSKNQDKRVYLIKESNILDYLSSLIRDNVVECVQILTGLIRSKDVDINVILNHRVFNEVINIYKELKESNYEKCCIIKFFRILYIYSSYDIERVEYLNELVSEDGLELLNLSNYSMDKSYDLKALLELIKLIRTIGDVELIENDLVSQIFIQSCIDLKDKFIVELLSEIYYLGVYILLDGKFMPFLQNLSSKMLHILDQIDLGSEGHFKLLNALIMFVKYANGSIDTKRIKVYVYDYFDKYMDSHDIFDDSFDVIFSSDCLIEPIIINTSLINLLYGINILNLTNNIDDNHLIFSKISNYIEVLVRNRTDYKCNWNVLEKQEYKFHLSRCVPLFHCFSNFLNLPLSQFTNVGSNGELFNINQLMKVISLQTMFTLSREEILKSLDMLIDKWSIYRYYISNEFIVNEFIAIYFNLPGNNELVTVLDDIEISIKLARVIQVYVFNIRNPIIKDGILAMERIGGVETGKVTFDIENLLEIYKSGLLVSHVSTISMLISLCYIMDTCIVESVWKDSEIMIQISKTIRCIKCDDNKTYICLEDIDISDDIIVLGCIEDYIRMDMIDLYREVNHQGKDIRRVLAQVGLEVYDKKNKT